MNKEVKDICRLDINLYRCISKKIDTDRVVLTNKSIIHIANHHPDAYDDVINSLRETILNPDYIIADDKRKDTGLIVRREHSLNDKTEHTFIELKVCVDSQNGALANSIISGWKISDKRLSGYLRNKDILYKR